MPLPGPYNPDAPDAAPPADQRFAAPDGSVYVVAPDGRVGTAPADAVATLGRGYRLATKDEAQAEQNAATAAAQSAPGPDDLQAAIGEKLVRTFTGGLVPMPPGAQARAQYLEQTHPWVARATEAVGMLPLGAAVATGAGALGAVVGGGLAGSATSFAAGSVGIGSQIEQEQSYAEGRNFSPTHALVSGVGAEILGRAGGWALSRALGGARNVVARSVETAAADDVERSMAPGWVNDYQTSQHADAYHTQLADTFARDLDSLETNFQKVAGISKKRAAAARMVSGDVQVQYAQGVQARAGLQQLRDTLAADPQLAGAGRALLKDLDQHLAQLESDGPAALSGPRLWRELDATRQTLQNYHVDLAQSLANDPARAWASRDVLTALDATENGVRAGLTQPEAWGQAAADLQRQYNAAFHEKWFPARKVVNQRLMFSPERDYSGRAVWRGEPGRVGRFLRNTDGPDAFRARELFGQYLDGAEAIVKLGQADSPQAARDALEAIRRLRRSPQLAAMVNASVARNASRSAIGEVGLGAVAGFVGGGPVGAMFGAGVARATFRAGQMGRWLGSALERMGVLKGAAIDIEALLAKGALPEAAASPADQLLRDLADSPFQSELRPRETGPVAGQPQVTPEGVPQPEQPEALPGIGPNRRSGGERPAGAFAIQPQRTIDVSGPAPVPPQAPVPVEPGATIRPGRGTLPPDEALGPSGALPEPPPTTERPTMPDATEPPPSPSPSPEGGYQPEPRRGYPSDLPRRTSEEPTHPAPNRSEGMAWYSGVMREGAEARTAEAQRMAQLLAEGDRLGHVEPDTSPLPVEPAPSYPISHAEFDDLVQSLTTADVRLPSGAPMADALREALPRLEHDGQVGALPMLEPPNGHVFVDEKTEGYVRQVLGPTIDRDTMKRLMPQDVLSKLGEAKPVSWYGFEDVDYFTQEHGTYVKVSAESRERVPSLPGGRTTKPIWTTQRTFVRDSRGLHVHHDYFFIAPGHQSGKVGEQVLRSQVEAYLQLGVRDIEVDATDVGKYYWPSIGFDRPAALPNALNAARGWLEELRLPDGPHELADAEAVHAGTATPEQAALVAARRAVQDPAFDIEKELASIRSLPSLANREWGKAFLLDNPGPWNSQLNIRLEEANPMFQLMRARLGLQGSAPLRLSVMAGVAPLPLALAAFEQAEGKTDNTPPSSPGPSLWDSAVATWRQAQARLVSDTVKRLFDQTQTPATGLPKPTTMTRPQLDARRNEIEGWAKNPEELQQRLVEGLRDVPDEHAGGLMLRVYQTAAFLQEKLPQAVRTSPLSLKPIPVSDAAVRKYAKYEDAALNPRDTIRRESATGHLSAETLETIDRLYPDLLVELRVAASERLHTDGVPPTLQARIAYGRLFGGNGSLADPALSAGVGMAAEQAFVEATPQPQPPSPPSRAQASAGPRPPAGVARAGAA